MPLVIPRKPRQQSSLIVKRANYEYGNAGPIATKTDPGNPVPTGTYDLEIPDEVHNLGTTYQGDSPFATTWFRVGHSGDRYLHPGRISAGCVTVTDTKKWTDVYNYLIKRRAALARASALLWSSTD